MPKEALERFHRVEYCDAEKVSWASKRVTTREEDMVYCSLGLFKVQLSLLYREGGDQAFFTRHEDFADFKIKVSSCGAKKQRHRSPTAPVLS